MHVIRNISSFHILCDSIVARRGRYCFELRFIREGFVKQTSKYITNIILINIIIFIVIQIIGMRIIALNSYFALQKVPMNLENSIIFDK